MAPSSYQAPRTDSRGQESTSQDARIAFEKAYSTTTVGDILKDKEASLYAVTVSSSLQAVIAELEIRKIGNMPVIDPNKGLVGVVSERDVIRATGEFGNEALARPVKGLHDCQSADLFESGYRWRCHEENDGRTFPPYACGRWR